MNDWRPTAPRRHWQLRARVYALIRHFFAEHGVCEVETPMLSVAGNPDPNIDSFVVQGTHAPCYLRTSPEFALKRLLAAGSGPIFELGRVFRRGEQGRWHNPEFTMLEWYRPGMDHRELQDEVVELLRTVLAAEGRPAERVRSMSFAELVERIAPNLDVWTSDGATISRILEQRGWYQGQLPRKDALDLLVAFGVTQINGAADVLAVYDYPPEMRALARLGGSPTRAARFEVYLGPHELANGYHELQDAAELGERFAAENRERQSRGQPPMPMDDRLIAAHQAGLPDCSGVALGVDRLLAHLAGARDLSEVIAITAGRA